MMHDRMRHEKQRPLHSSQVRYVTHFFDEDIVNMVSARGGVGDGKPSHTYLRNTHRGDGYTAMADAAVS